MRAPGRDTAGQERPRGRKGHGGRPLPQAVLWAIHPHSHPWTLRGLESAPASEAVLLDMGSPGVKSLPLWPVPLASLSKGIHLYGICRTRQKLSVPCQPAGASARNAELGLSFPFLKGRVC